MILILESTDQVVMIGDVPATAYTGTLPGGLPVSCLVAELREQPTIDMEPIPGNPGAYAPA